MKKLCTIALVGLSVIGGSCTPPCPPAILDRDGDCVADSMDKCQDAAEVKNDFRDGDGCPDNLPIPLDRSVTMRLESISFAQGTAELAGDSPTMLQNIADRMERFPYMQIEINCYEDNGELAQKRAESIKTWIQNQGIAPERMQAVGKPMPANPEARTDPSVKRID